MWLRDRDRGATRREVYAGCASTKVRGTVGKILKACATRTRLAQGQPPKALACARTSFRTNMTGPWEMTRTAPGIRATFTERSSLMAAPRCRSCCIAPTPRRTPNRATHLAFYADGLATLLCSLHVDMALRAGGFAVDLKKLPVLFDEACDRETLANMVQMAEIGSVRRARVRSELYEPRRLELEQ